MNTFMIGDVVYLKSCSQAMTVIDLFEHKEPVSVSLPLPPDAKAGGLYQHSEVTGFAISDYIQCAYFNAQGLMQRETLPVAALQLGMKSL